MAVYFHRIFLKNRHILLYGCLLAVLVFILKWLQWKFLITDNAMEIYVGLIAVFFTALGVWIATQLVKPKVETVVIEKEIYRNPPEAFAIDEAQLKELNFSTREYEVLQLLAKGHSNAEIADSLFLAVSTIKSHISNIFVKLDVKNRTQALEKSKRLRILG